MKFKALILISLLTILLSNCGSVSGDPLDSTGWELYAISKHRPIEGSTITISFEDGRVTGFSGCNSYGSEYQVNGSKITFEIFESTLMACADPAMMDQETAFMQMLGNSQRFELADGQLLIYWSEHEALTFAPADE